MPAHQTKTKGADRTETAGEDDGADGRLQARIHSPFHQQWDVVVCQGRDEGGVVLVRFDLSCYLFAYLQIISHVQRFCTKFLVVLPIFDHKVSLSVLARALTFFFFDKLIIISSSTQLPSGE